MKYVRWSIAAISLLPVSAFAFYKPVRVLVPEMFGVRCNAQNVCVDDPAQLDAATALVDSARRFLETQWRLSIGEPRIIFCSTTDCQQTFGHATAAGYTFGTLGIIIQPRGWKQHYVAHELIHYWQSKNFGSLSQLYGKPWVIEGMAYALSGDPRKELHEPFESYRRQFAEWYRMRVDTALIDSIGEIL